MRPILLCFVAALSIGFSSAYCSCLAPDRITEIKVDHLPGYGAFPTYTVTLKPDGTVLYHGTAFVKRIGDFTAKTKEYEFAILANAIEDIQFDQMNSEYKSDVADYAVTEYVIERKASTKRVLVQDGSFAPSRLWLFRRTVDAIVDEATNWKRVSPKK